MEQRRQEAGQRAMDSLQGLASGHPSAEAAPMANCSSSAVRHRASLCSALCQGLPGGSVDECQLTWELSRWYRIWHVHGIQDHAHR